MTTNQTPSLRRLRISDAPAVLAAFESNPDMARQGEVASLADWALTTRGLERVELGHRVDNPASGAVARSAGFVKEGTERGKFLIDGQRIDVDTYGRLASDPAPPFEAISMID